MVLLKFVAVLSLQFRLKGISICFNILKSALCGNYVNFGVLKLYGDTALDRALDVFIKMLISLPLKNLLVSLDLFRLCSCSHLCFFLLPISLYLHAVF